MSMEDALNGVKAYYLESDNLDTALAAIESARSVTIPRWADLDVGFIETMQYPSIGIVASTTAHDYGEVTDFLDPWYDHAVALLIAQSGNDKNSIQFDLMRYVEAIAAISTGSRTKYQYNDRFDTVQLDDVTYSIEEAHDEKKFLQITVFELIVREIRT